MTKEEHDRLNYPRWIYKEGEDPKIVQNVFEHADMCEKGWSGPPLFYTEVGDLEVQIEKAEKELAQMKKQLATLKASERAEKEKERVRATAANGKKG